MKRIDPFVLGIIIILMIILAGGVFFAYKMGGKPMQTYSIEDQERPIIELEKTHIDLGNIKVSDTIVEKIDFKNIGEKTLQIANIKTSCGCTTAQVEINGEKSPMFSMHNNPAWTGEIEPGSEAILEAIYEPSKMPVQGKVERTIFFKTNDPAKSDVNIHLVAIVD